MKRNPIFNFDGLTSTGLHEVPVNGVILIEEAGSGPRQIVITDKTSINSSTTITELLTLTAQWTDYSNYLLSGYAKLASPALTGTPTAPTATGGDNTTIIATTAFVQGALSGWTFESSQQSTPTIVGKLAVSHGLGYVPSDFLVLLKCVVVDQGYAIGDEIQLHTDINSSGRMTLWASSTEVGCSVSHAGSYIAKTNQDTGASADFIASSWRVVFKAR